MKKYVDATMGFNGFDQPITVERNDGESDLHAVSIGELGNPRLRIVFRRDSLEELHAKIGAHLATLDESDVVPIADLAPDESPADEYARSQANGTLAR